MDAHFWHSRWQNNEIGFHNAEVNPHLRRFWPELGLAPGARVLVPLCGKSVDMLWLREQGYHVVGVELSPLAVEQFFVTAGLEVTVRQNRDLQHWSAAGIEIFCGDLFALDAAQLGPVDGFYDRAALVALPPAMRRDYAGKLASLAGTAEGLLISLEYSQPLVDGPPFSVAAEEVAQLLQPDFCVSERNQQLSDDLPPKFRQAGVSALIERVYRLRPR